MTTSKARKRGQKKAPAKVVAKPQPKPIEKVIEKVENTEQIEAVEETQRPSPAEETPNTVEAVEEKDNLSAADKKTLKEFQTTDLQTADKKTHFMLNGKVQFWRSLISLPSKGIVSGPVIVGEMVEFFARTPKPVDYSRWMNDTDKVQERYDKAKAKIKKKGK